MTASAVTTGPDSGPDSRPGSRSAAAISSQLRGSSLLTLGKLLAVAANLGIQVLIVRYLTKSAYGAFAYALSLVTMLSTLITLGIQRAIPRFAAMYDEKGEYGKLAGTFVLQLGTIGVLGLSAILFTLGLRQWLTNSVIGDAEVVGVLTILVLLAPLQALDSTALSVFAVYSRPRAIFFRRYVVTPALRFAVVAVLIAGGLDERALALGWVLIGAAGLGIYAVMLRDLFSTQHLGSKLRSKSFEIPYREVLGFALPLLTTDVLFVLLNTADVVLINRYGSTADVGSFRAVQPAAKMNQFVMTSFALLYTPVVARHFSRGDRAGVSDLYWRTASWITVLTFPVLILTFSLSGPLTETLFGAEYSGSAVFMALLAVGYYFNAALGFNGLTVKTYGRVGYSVAISSAAAVTNVVLNVLLIPRYGPMGAALGTLATLVAHNLLKQLGLRLGTGIPLFRLSSLPLYTTVVVGAGGLYLLVERFDLSLATAGLPAVLTVVAVVAVARRDLQVEDTFPELARLPVIGRLASGAPETDR